MLVPSIFNGKFVDNLIDEVFQLPFVRGGLVSGSSVRMNTDVKDLGDRYEFNIELPGYSKENIKAQLRDGYLTISANQSEESNTQDKDGNFVRRERYSGSCQRAFYVGENLKEEDIKAKFENGILRLEIPKNEKQAEIENKKYIPIE